ncbi:L-sorbose 1-phosphate reductase [Aerococcus christensenii]|uniref:L-sorbose 1-phosphate reductase n=1 Tax=Aerococcus christensenii TaxID=87541 RepID=A0A2I1K5N8_9LACT|nr:alcohol dehydrogenase catalytic domain-containing protein [Aerococcus christensenii]PKY90845.1 L-sorbose 1-phosphate reductase [Aerococcus christensenii]
MKTKAVRLYGKNDLRLEEIELPVIKESEILVSVITDSICMSSWKLVQKGEEHKKAPDDLKNNPILIGHEFCGKILEVGNKWKDKYKVGDKYIIQANLQLKDRPDCPGYSYAYTGGDTQYAILSEDVMNQDCLLIYRGDSYFKGSLVEPLSTVIRAFKTNYHNKDNKFEHIMGIKEGGNLLIIGGTGAMGMLAVDYALHGPVNPKTVTVTGINQEIINRLESLYTSTEDTKLNYVNVKDCENQKKVLMDTIDGKFDDIFIMVADSNLVELASDILAPNGCINFFAGPQNKSFKATINLYDIHYSNAHYVGNSGGNAQDMKEAISLIENSIINVENIVTHILGLNEVVNVTTNFPKIKGWKKLVYTHKNIPLTKLSDINQKSDLYNILKSNNNLWSKEAEKYILENAKEI